MAIFIEYPWLAALIGLLLLWLGRSRGSRVAVAAGLTWLLYTVYETLLVLTLAGVVSLFRTRRPW